MHNGFINVDNQKMSKSLGNFFTVRDIAKEFDLEAVRMFMLSAQYRSPINFSREMIEQAKASLDRLYTARDHYLFLLENAKDGEMGEKEQALMEMAGVFGILTRKADEGDEKVKTLLEARAKARAEKNWAESDRLRNEIAALGYVLKDTKQGQQVTKAM